MERSHSILKIWNGATPFSHNPKPNATLGIADVAH
jgi:hypothetical protein